MSPGPVTPADVQAARDAYDGLTQAEKDLVTNLNDLVIAEDSATKIAADKATVDVTYATAETSTTVKSDVTLVAAVTQGSNVTWVSSNSAIAENGAVTRPIISAGDATGKVTATITHGTVVDTKEFTVTVLKKNFTIEASTPQDKKFRIVPDGYDLTDFSATAYDPANPLVGVGVITFGNNSPTSTIDGIEMEIKYDNTTGEVTVEAKSGTLLGAANNAGILVHIDGSPSYGVGGLIRWTLPAGTTYDAFDYLMEKVGK